MTEKFSLEGPTCPYCGYQHHADEAFFFDEDFCDYECAECDKKFAVSTRVEWSWTTRMAGEPQ